MNLETIAKLKRDGIQIGFTCSSFDLLHAGHVAMLAEARSMCDYLIVGLQTDPTIDRPQKNKPVQSVFERWVQLQGLSYVDMIVPYGTEQDLLDMLYVLMPDVRFVGEEYRGLPHTGKGMEGIEICYNNRRHSFSSTELRSRVHHAEGNKNGNAA